MASLERYPLPVKSCSPVFALITGALERSTNIAALHRTVATPGG